MHLAKELANQIRTKSRAILDREVVVAGPNGIVLASDANNGEFAAEALRAAQEGRQLSAHLGTERVTWCPFVYEDQTIGVFGIILAGGSVTPEAINLLQGLAEVIVHQYFLIDRVQSTDTVRAEFITELLTAAQINPDDIYRRADILQLNLPRGLRGRFACPQRPSLH
jgi:sugar diacid utilization regulator